MRVENSHVISMTTTVSNKFEKIVVKSKKAHVMDEDVKNPRPCPRKQSLRFAVQ